MIDPKKLKKKMKKYEEWVPKKASLKNYQGKSEMSLKIKKPKDHIKEDKQKSQEKSKVSKKMEKM